jgi:hypothetical protein
MRLFVDKMHLLIANYTSVFHMRDTFCSNWQTSNGFSFLVAFEQSSEVLGSEYDPVLQMELLADNNIIEKMKIRHF